MCIVHCEGAILKRGFNALFIVKRGLSALFIVRLPL